MGARENIEVMLEIFHRIERRDPRRPDVEGASALFHPNVEFHWPPPLPYGGTTRGLRVGGRTWGATWDPLQPTETERRLDPRVVAASEDEVVVLWRQRGLSQAGDRVDGEVLGLYKFRDGKLARAQMFYFDIASVLHFLGRVTGPSDRAEDVRSSPERVDRGGTCR